MGPLVCRGALWCVIHVFSQPMGGAAYVVPGCCCGQCFAFGGGNTRMPHDRFSVSLGISTFTDLKEKANRMGNMAIKAATYIAVIMVAGFDPVASTSMDLQIKVADMDLRFKAMEIQMNKMAKPSDAFCGKVEQCNSDLPTDEPDDVGTADQIEGVVAPTQQL